MKNTTICVIATSVLVLVITLALHIQRDNSTTPYLYEGTLSAHEKHDRYIIKIAQMGEKEKHIHFNKKREIIKKKGIEPLKAEAIQIFDGIKYTEVIQKYGEPHADIGSGFFIPAYITEDGYLISFHVKNNNVIADVYKQDLLGHGT